MIAYLAESSEVTENGDIHGKIIRCYEVEVDFAKKGASTMHTYPRLEHTATGWVYVLKNDKIVKQRTKATLKNKYVNGYQQGHLVKTSINEHPHYTSCYYKTPELALLAKLNNIRRDYIAQKNRIAKILKKLNSCEPYIKSFYKLVEDYPELLV